MQVRKVEKITKGNFTFFTEVLRYAINTIPIEKLGVGLETINEDNNDAPFTPAELTERFNLIEEMNVQEIDIWRASLPDNWWPYIKGFINSEKSC